MDENFEKRVLEGLRIISENQQKQNFSVEQIRGIIVEGIDDHERKCRKGDVLDTVEKWFVLAQNNPVMAGLFLIAVGVMAYFGLR